MAVYWRSLQCKNEFNINLNQFLHWPRRFTYFDVNNTFYKYVEVNQKIYVKDKEFCEKIVDFTALHDIFAQSRPII